MEINITKIPVGTLQANCYIVSSKNLPKVLIIDSGGDFLKIKERISELKKEAGAVLLTHCHFDHAGACHLFEKEGVPIYLSEKDSYLINSYANLGEMFGEKMQPFKVADKLSEGKIEICGFDIEVLETSGHTAGSLSFKIGDCVFTGDTIFAGGYGRTDFPTGSEKDLVLSAEKLFSIKENCIFYTGHGDKTTLEIEKANNPINFLF